MKSLQKLLLVLLTIYFVYTFVPAVAYVSTQKANAPAPAPEPTETPIPAESLLPNFLEGTTLPGEQAEEDAFPIYDVATDQNLTVPADEFVAAAVACEMDLSSPAEALKAQAVAAYTYYTHLRDSGETIACDSGNWLVYVPQSTMQARWGEDYETNMALLQGIVEEVRGQLLTWRGEPALTTYFAISSGSTEAAANVWDSSASEACPYLQPVASPGDRLSDGYLSSRTFSEDEFRQAAAASFTDNPPDLSGPSSQWLTDIEYTPTGTVKQARLGGVEVTGSELRSAFSLRSACFTLTAGEGSLTFEVRGWGHDVGMSQAGAVFLAEQGAGYKEILAHYYPGTKLTFPQQEAPDAHPTEGRG